MSSGSVAKIAVKISVNHPATKMINFNYKQHKIQSSMYQNVIDGIENGIVNARVDDDLFGKRENIIAQYFFNRSPNLIAFRSTIYYSTILSPTMRGTIVHEATHCFFDITKYKILNKEAEAFCFLADSIHRRVSTGQPSQKSEYANRLVQTIINNQNIDLTKNDDMAKWIDAVVKIYDKDPTTKLGEGFAETNG
jgi:hypothetical protein